jgi:hypothetical protein
MNDRRWYEAEALMADSTSRSHAMAGASEAEVERKIRNRYPDAVAILVRRETWTESRHEPTARIYGTQGTRGSRRRPER